MKSGHGSWLPFGTALDWRWAGPEGEGLPKEAGAATPATVMETWFSQSVGVRTRGRAKEIFRTGSDPGDLQFLGAQPPLLRSHSVTWGEEEEQVWVKGDPFL